jgi:GT2 family glycosyltransferase
LISIIVLTHNRRDLTQSCLEALTRSESSKEHEVILVDNASTEGIRELAGEFRDRFRNFQYWRNDENLSFSIANNAAAERAHGSWLLFLNNDVIVGEKSIEELIRALANDPGAGIAGARLIFPDSGKVQHAGIEQMLWGYASNYGAGADVRDQRLRFKRPVFAVTGAMLGMSRSLFHQVRGFDEQYRWGYEDLDLCLKVSKIGKNILYVPEAEGRHWESATLREIREPADFGANYAHYRNRWNDLLVPRERRYLESIRSQHAGRVVVFGTGQAAAALQPLLRENGIEVEAFTTTSAVNEGTCFQGRPVVPLAHVGKLEADLIIVGSQFYFEVEDLIKEAAPHHRCLFPVIL